MINTKSVVGYEGLYEVDELGTVTRVKTGKVVGVSISPLHQYRYISLRKDGKTKSKTLHRAVAEAFIPNPDNKPQINHIDGNKANNAASNLEWMTDKENKQAAIATGHFKTHKGKRHSEETIVAAFGDFLKGSTNLEIAATYGFTAKNMARMFRLRLPDNLYQTYTRIASERRKTNAFTA